MKMGRGTFKKNANGTFNIFAIEMPIGLLRDAVGSLNNLKGVMNAAIVYYPFLFYVLSTQNLRKLI